MFADQKAFEVPLNKFDRTFRALSSIEALDFSNSNSLFKNYTESISTEGSSDQANLRCLHFEE